MPDDFDETLARLQGDGWTHTITTASSDDDGVSATLMDFRRGKEMIRLKITISGLKISVSCDVIEGDWISDDDAP